MRHGTGAKVFSGFLCLEADALRCLGGTRKGTVIESARFLGWFDVSLLGSFRLEIYFEAHLVAERRLGNIVVPSVSPLPMVIIILALVIRRPWGRRKIIF